MKRLILILLASAAVMSAEAAVLKNQAVYFDPEYTGTERGTLSRPYNSLSDLAGSSIREGVTLYLKRGTVFRESFQSVSMKGSANRPVTFTAYGAGESPVIRGTRRITGWSDEDGDGIWEAPLAEEITSLFIDGIKQTLARYPNRDAENDGWAKITDQLKKHPDFAHMLVVGGLKDAEYWTHARCVVRAAAWKNSILRVKKWDNAKKILYFTEPLHQNGAKYGIGWGFYLENVLEELDAEGEWYYDPSGSTLYYKKPADINLSENIADGAVLDTGFDLTEDNGYIRFANLRVEGFKSCAISSGASHITVDTCSFNNNDTDIYCFGKVSRPVSGITIRNSAFKNSYEFCIKLNRINGYTVENNRIEDNQRTAMLISLAANGRVAGNTIRNTGYNGIHLNKPIENNVVEYNFIDGFCARFTDGGAYYAWDNEARSTKDPNDASITGWNVFRNNMARNGHTTHLANGRSAHNSSGIYLDDNIVKWRLINNMIIEPGNVGIFLHNTRETVTSGNLLYGGSKQNIYVSESHHVGDWWKKAYGTYESVSDNIITNNICYINTPPQSGLPALNLGWSTFYEHPDDMISTLDGNRYYNPFQDLITGRRHFVDGVAAAGGTKVQELLTLADHQNVTGLNQDRHSVKSPGDRQVLAAEEIGEVLIPNSNFSEPIDAVACQPRDTGRADTWVTLSKVKGILNGDCLKVVPGSKGGSVWLSGGADGRISISKGKVYRVSFIAQADVPHAMNVVIRQNRNQKQNAGCNDWVAVGSVARHCTVNFIAGMDEPDIRIVFKLNRNIEYIYIDDVRLTEVRLIERDNSIPLLNTNLDHAVNVPLEEGRYLDLGGAPVDNPVRVDAWSARIVIRNENLIRNSDVEEAFENGVAAGFTTWGSGASVRFSEEAETVFHGAKSQKIRCAALPRKETVFYGQQNIPLRAGNEYTAGVYLYPSDGVGRVALKLQSDAGVVLERLVDVSGSGWRKCSMTGYAGADGSGFFGLEFFSPGTWVVDWMEVKQLYNKLTNWSFEEGACTESAVAPGWIKPERAVAQTEYSAVSNATTGAVAQKIKCITPGASGIRTVDIPLLMAGEDYVVKLNLKGRIRSNVATLCVYRAEDDRLLHTQTLPVANEWQEAVVKFSTDEKGADATYLRILLGDEQGAAAADYLIMDDVRYYQVYRNYAAVE